MARYIDADVMQDFLVEMHDVDDWCISQYNADWISSFIESQPTADVVEVKRGEWREVNEKYPRYVCTVCNHLFNNKNYNYCPCCGAKMDGGKAE